MRVGQASRLSSFSRSGRSATGFPACEFWRLSSRQFPNTGLESPVNSQAGKPATLPGDDFAGGNFGFRDLSVSQTRRRSCEITAEKKQSRPEGWVRWPGSEDRSCCKFAGSELPKPYALVLAIHAPTATAFPNRRSAGLESDNSNTQPLVVARLHFIENTRKLREYPLI
jgi:hypothetical protein